ncbi:MAG: TlpA family protein disulfide reductase [Acidobacteriota bacterium]|nr:MAG: TlpA family protein disulfide reductase [Acidobacteriota bacterium]
MKCISCSPCIFSKIALLIGLVVAYFGGCTIASQKTSSPPSVGQQQTEIKRGTAIGDIAPDFDLAKFDGGNISLKELEGSPAVLVFWTAWCPVCKEEAPHVNKLAAEFEAKGVKVVGINIGESDARVAEGIKDFGIEYTVAIDKDTSVAKSYKVVGTPTVVFLDKKGSVQYFGNEVPKDYPDRLNKIIGS